MSRTSSGETNHDGLSWAIEPSHFPAPVTRWTAELFVRHQTAAIAAICARYGLLLDGIALREFHGRVYTAVVPLGGKPRPAPPAFLVPLLCRLVPELRKRIKLGRQVQANGETERIIDRWLGGGEEKLLAAGRSLLRDAEVQDLSNAELASLLERAMGLAKDGIYDHFELHGAGVNTIGMLGAELMLEQGWIAAAFTELFTGLSSTSTGPAAAQAAIIELVERAGASDRLAAATSLDEVRAIGGDVAEAIDRYLVDWATRAVRYEVAYPTVAERPEWFLRTLREQARRPASTGRDAAHLARREAREQALVSALGDTPETRQRLAQAQRAFPIREGNETATVGVPVAAARRVGRRIGARLVEDGQLERADDVFDLEVAEVLALLRGTAGVPADPATRAAARRDERLAAATRDVPFSVGAPPSQPPELRGFPPDVARTVRAVLWYTDKIFGDAPALPDGAAPRSVTGDVAGEGVSPGMYEGPARIVLDESDFDRIEAGDVLVCPITSPVWSMLFPLLGALVCDAGGPLSHPAIIAREFAIPAVVATQDATRRLTDGARVRVDGTAGTVSPA